MQVVLVGGKNMLKQTDKGEKDALVSPPAAADAEPTPKADNPAAEDEDMFQMDEVHI